MKLFSVKTIDVNEQGFIIASCITIFVALLVFFLIPRNYITAQAPGPCVAGFAPGRSEVLNLPAIKNMFDEPHLAQAHDISIGGPDPNEMAEYILIRQSVPFSDKENTPGWKLLGEKIISGNTHTIYLGEIPEKPGFDVYYPAEWGEMDLPGKGRFYIRGEGLIIFVNKDPRLARVVDGIPLYFGDVYQDKRRFSDPQKKYTTEELFLCKNNPLINKQNILIPAQTVSPNNEQLQLEWFAFDKAGEWGFHCKPAVYLYPPKKMSINVKVHPAGTLIYTDPQYDSKTGWTVDAYPDGKIYDSRSTIYDKPFNYLYFESKVPDQIIKKPTKGWIVQSSADTAWYEPLQTKFETLLPQLGLNQDQTKDFVDYWKKALPYSPYYFVGVIDQANVDQIEKLEITPKPDSINRVRIYFERLDQPKQIEAPLLEAKSFKLQASSFSVVEWGGMVKNDPNHPFTCSQ